MQKDLRGQEGTPVSAHFQHTGSWLFLALTLLKSVAITLNQKEFLSLK